VTPELYPQIVAALRRERNAKSVGLAFSIGQSRARRIAKAEGIDLIPRGAYIREAKQRDAVRQSARRLHQNASFRKAQRAGIARFYADPKCRKRHAKEARRAALRRWARERTARADERQAALAEHKAWAQSREVLARAAPSEQAQARRTLKLKQQAHRQGWPAATAERKARTKAREMSERALPSEKAQALRPLRPRRQARALSRRALPRWARERQQRAEKTQVAIAEHQAWSEARDMSQRPPPSKQAQALRALKLRQQARRSPTSAADRRGGD
jgi:hypothetical protein